MFRYRGEGNIKMAIKGVGWEGINWNALAQDKGTGGMLL
jgi:hypothetical protein